MLTKKSIFAFFSKLSVAVTHCHFPMKMALNQAILVVGFKKNLCVGAYAGAIQIGEIENRDLPCFKEKESVTISQKKLPEFQLLVEELGRNLATEGEKSESTSFQLSRNEKVVLEKSKILTYRQNCPSKAEFTLEFDEFIYMDFLSAMSNVLLFITMPSKEQFLAMKKYADTKNEKTTEARIDTVTREIANPSPYRMFMLEQFLRINIPVIDIFTKILCIIGEK